MRRIKTICFQGTIDDVFNDVNLICQQPVVITLRVEGVFTIIGMDKNKQFICKACHRHPKSCVHAKRIQAWALEKEVDFEESASKDVNLDELQPLSFNGIYPLALEEHTTLLIKERARSGILGCFPFRAGFPRITSPDLPGVCPSCLNHIQIYERIVTVFSPGWSGKCKG